MRSLVPNRITGTMNGSNGFGPAGPVALDPTRVLDRFVSDLWGNPPAARTRGEGAPMDVVELDDSLRISVEVPGIDPEGLEIQLRGQVLTLTAEKADPHAQEAGSRTWSERLYGAFKRSIELPCPIDPDSVEAVHRHGVLTLTMQKAEAVRAKRIEVTRG